MIRIAKSDHSNSNAPRIDSITPEAVLPGGEVELGRQLAGSGGGTPSPRRTRRLAGSGPDEPPQRA